MKNNIPKKYWSGEGRKIIVIPQSVLKNQKSNNPLLDTLHITDLGYYPTALGHHTHRKNGSLENILIYCAQGKGWIKTAAGTFEVNPNTFFILPQNTEHEYGADKQDPWSVYWIRFGGSGLGNLNELEFAKYCFTPKHFPYQTEAVQMFNEIFRVLEQGYGRQYLIYVNMVLVNFLMLFIFQHGSILKKQARSPHDSIVEKAVACMQANIQQQVSMHTLARAAGCSLSRLSALFKASTGYSPINYFIHLKMQRACQLLYASDTLIKEVAAGLGYDDQYYFSRLFTKLMGLSPGAYKKRNKQK